MLRRDPLLDLTVSQDRNYTVELYDFLYKGGDNYTYRLSVSNQPRVDFVFHRWVSLGAEQVHAIWSQSAWW